MSSLVMCDLIFFSSDWIMLDLFESYGASGNVRNSLFWDIFNTLASALFIVLFVIVDYHELTLNPMTTDSALTMSSDNKGVVRLPEGHFLSYDSDSESDSAKEKSWRKEFCSEMLSGGRFYWQVDWKGFIVSFGVKFKTKVMSFTKKVLHLCCSSGQYVAVHEDKFQTRSTAIGVMPKSSTVGVFLDCAGGTLSFYSILPHGPVHLHTAFNDPVSPYFDLNATDLEIKPSSVIIHTLDPSSVVRTYMLLLPKVKEAFERLSFDPFSRRSAWH